MAEHTSYPPGTPSWIDLGTEDVDKTSAFYSELFGWTVEDLGIDAGNYRMAKLRGKEVAGLGPSMGGPAAWATYVTTADVSVTADTVVANGGTVVMPPLQVFEAGHMAVFTDAEGAFFSAWQPGKSIGCELTLEPGTLCWNELNSRDQKKAIAFYGAVFGWKADVQEAGGTTYASLTLADGESVVGGCLQMTDEMQGIPPHWMVYFAVDDCEKAVGDVERLGGHVTLPPFDIPNVGRNAVVTGPHGEVFSVIRVADSP